MLLNNDRGFIRQRKRNRRKQVVFERDAVQKALLSYNRLVTGAVEKNRQQSRWMHFNAHG